MREAQNESEISLQSFLLGLSTGSVYELNEISPSLFKVLAVVEDVISKHYMTLGDFSHSEWRYPDEQAERESKVRQLIDFRSIQEKKSFVDGDFIKFYLDFSEEEQVNLLQTVNTDLENSKDEVEEILSDLVDTRSKKK